MDKIVDLCKRYKVTLIEDAAESLGTTYKGKYTGTFGDYGIFSFNGNKIITTSGGGMLVSNNPERIEKVRFWSTQARDKARHYQHSELGFNYRMSNIVAGIGRGQLKVLDQRVTKKQYIYNYYKENLKIVDDIEFMPVNNWNSPNCWLTSIILKGKIKPVNVIEALEQENIESRPIWKPMHIQPFFERFDYIGSKNSEYIFNYGLCLPSDTKLSNQQLDLVIEVIKGLWSNV
jgi:dTDP-4-amino-4,6-dideoxygalactose transaminase